MGSAIQWIEQHQVLVGAITSILATTLTLVGGFVVGEKITARWNMRVRDREADLGAIQRLRQLYGEFLSARRAWNLHIRSHALKALDERGLHLLDRAAATEGEMEAILMKIAQERKLEPDEIKSLGLVRQAYQKLRESIRNLEPLGWGHGDHPHYVP